MSRPGVLGVALTHNVTTLFARHQTSLMLLMRPALLTVGCASMLRVMVRHRQDVTDKSLRLTPGEAAPARQEVLQSGRARVDLP